MGGKENGALSPNKQSFLAVIANQTTLEKPEEMSLLISRSDTHSFDDFRRPRSLSVLYMLNSAFPGGVLTRMNYMSRCFYAAWVQNQADIPRLKMVLWKNPSARTNVWVELVALLIQWVLPFTPLFFFASPLDFRTLALRVIIWVLLMVEFMMSLWHCYLLYVTIKNLLVWKTAWFTFQVPIGTIGIVDTFSSGLAEFNGSANVRSISVRVGTLRRLQTVSRHDQDALEANMRSRHMEQAEIILFTEDFLDSFSTWPRNMCLSLLVATTLSQLLVVYFLVKAYTKVIVD